MNTTLKHAAEWGLITSGVARFRRRRLRERTLVLAYHNIVPRGELASGDSSLHLPQREFARQLDVLRRSHDVVPIETILNRPSTARRPRAVITFDDAYAGALGAGVDELAKRGMPATIFVAPGLLGSVTWWDALAERTHGVIPREVRRHALEDLGGNGEAILRWSHSDSNPALPRIATEVQLATSSLTSGITLGSHTWSHRNLCTLIGHELDREFVRPLLWLRSRFANVVPWVSYPYGQFGDAIARAAANAGYLGAFRIEGGWVPNSPFSFAIPRVDIPSGVSINGFRLRLAGF